jgi:hypothetical protein
MPYIWLPEPKPLHDHPQGRGNLVVYPVQHFLRLANRSLLLTNGTPVGQWELEYEWEVPFDILNSVPEVLGHPVRH